MPDPNESKENEPKPSAQESLRQSVLGRSAVRISIMLENMAMLMRRDISWEELKDPESKTGLIEGAILGGSLLIPDEDQENIIYKQAAPGEFMAYDFNRPREFPKTYKKYNYSLDEEGSPFAFPIDEVKDSSPDQLTPTGLFRLFTADHALTFVKPTLEELIESYGFVAPTTYEEAYDAAGLYDEFAEDLASRNHARQQIYTITPKGNTLVFLGGGDSPTPPKEDPQFEPAFAGGIRLA